MKYSTFETKVKGLVRKANVQAKVRFWMNDEGTVFYARLETKWERITIMGYTDTVKVTVKWGQGHMAQVVL